jgi:potassium channel subfamily K
LSNSSQADRKLSEQEQSFESRKKNISFMKSRYFEYSVLRMGRLQNKAPPFAQQTVGNFLKMFQGKIVQVGSGKSFKNYKPNYVTSDKADEENQNPEEGRGSITANGLAGFLQNERAEIQLALPLSSEETEVQWIGESFWETYELNSGWLFKFFRLFLFFTVSVIIYEKLEHWSFLNCVYFIVQTITTVGYGNITPKTRKARVFTMFFMFIGILLAFSIINDIARFLVSYFRSKYKKSRKLDKFQVFVRKFLNLLMWISILTTIIVFGALVFYVNEDWTMIDSLYFAVVTISSLGYGDLALQKDSSIWFNCFYMFIFVAVTALCLEKISSFKRHLEKAELWQILEEIELSQPLIDAINKKTGKVNKEQYILHMLQLEGKLDYEDDILRWNNKFVEFDEDHDGFLTSNDVEQRRVNLRQESFRSVPEGEEAKTTWNLFFGRKNNVFYRFYKEVRDVFLETIGWKVVLATEVMRGSVIENPLREESKDEFKGQTAVKKNSVSSGGGSEAASHGPSEVVLSPMIRAKLLRRASLASLNAKKEVEMKSMHENEEKKKPEVGNKDSDLPLP